MRSISACIAVLGALCSLDAFADETIDALRQQVNELMNAVEQLNERIDALESENEALRNQQQDLRTDIETMPPPVAAPSTATRGGIGQRFNPDIGVVLDTVGTLTEMEPEDFEEDEGFDRFSVREIELNIGHDIDPYSRLDLTLTFSDFEDVSIEEAYVYYARLPLEFAGRVGRFRLPVGLSNPLHRDQLFTVDEPLVVQRYLGLEGLSRTGVEVTRFLPQFNDSFTQQVRFGVVEGGIGEEGTLFGESRQQPTYFGRLRNTVELSPADRLDFGVSYLAGNAEETEDDVDVMAWGVDAQYAHQFGSFRALTLQAEALLQDRDEALTDFAEEDPWGYYLLANFRATRRWEFGGRYDWVEVADYDPFGDEAHERDDEQAFSAWVTFHQSEFARWRLQYEHIELADGLDDDRLMLQGTFIIGWHQHPIR